jgi:2'-5' RNA ligase
MDAQELRLSVQLRVCGIISSMRKESLRCNIVLYPPVEVAREAMAVSHSLAPFGDALILDGIHHYPRVTIYSFELDPKDLEETARRIDQIAAMAKPFKLKFRTYVQTKAGYIFATLIPRAPLLAFQTRIIRALNPLRKSIKPGRDVLAWEKKNLLHYGYRWVGAKFEPHITFAHLKSDRLVKDLTPHLPKHPFVFEANHVHLCVFDAERDAWRNFQKFKLGE